MITRPPPPQMFAFQLVPPGSLAFSFDNLAGKISGDWEAEIDATCLGPEKFAARSATVLVSSSILLDDQSVLLTRDPNFPVGSITANKNAVEVLVHVPSSTIPCLMAAIASEQIQFLTVAVEDRRLQHARIFGLTFEGARQFNR